MTTAIVFHEVKDGHVWAKAWRPGPGSRHELFSKIGVTARTFRDPKNPNAAGLIFSIPDTSAFDALLASPEGKRAMDEDGLKLETLRVLTEFSP